MMIMMSTAGFVGMYECVMFIYEYFHVFQRTRLDGRPVIVDEPSTGRTRRPPSIDNWSIVHGHIVHLR